MSTDKSAKEVLQHIINEVRKWIDTVEDQLQRFEKRKKDHKRKIEETTNGWLQNFKEYKKVSNSADLAYLSLAITSLYQESEELEAEEAQRVKDLQTALQSFIITNLQVEEEECILKKHKRQE